MKKQFKNFIFRCIRFIFKGVPVYKVYPKIVTLAPNDLLNGRSALITGGTSGIGYEIAKSFLLSGASVVITGRNIERVKISCKKLEAETKATLRVFGIEMDSRNINSFEAKLQEVVRLLGKVDILINNAGVLRDDVSNDIELEYDTIMNTNLKGTFFLTHMVSQYMIENSIRGNILNIASSSSLRPAVNAYTLSKWGVKGLTLGMAKKLIKYGIVVNGIAPGPTATPMMNKDTSNDLSLPNNPSGRFTTPEEIANIAQILVSNLGRQIVGDIVYISGGAGVITYDDIQY